MPPRTKKTKKGEEVKVELPPVIFFLRIGKDFEMESEQAGTPLPSGAAGATQYSEILHETETRERRFDESIIHDLMSKLHLQKEYPKGTACFWCCHGFSGSSFVVPIYYDVYTNMHTAEGNYCSPECALAYIYKDSELSESEKWRRHSLLRAMYSALYVGKDIFPAPDKRVLRLFGGNLDIQQYREFVYNSTKPLQIAMPPVRLYIPSVNTQATTKDIKSYVSLTNETVDKASQQLRLKRSKPVHEGGATLDKCFTIVK